MKVSDVVLVPGLGGFFHDDLAAIRGGAVADGQWYRGRPVTSGFSSVRTPARALGIGLRLEDGRIAWGDAMAVQYAGLDGRDPLVGPGEEALGELRGVLVGLEADAFRPALAAALAALPEAGASLRYGLSQALLDAAAQAGNRTMCEVLCAEYGLPVVVEPVPVYAQTGDERYGNADKMIIKRVDALPHGLINNRAKFGAEGEKLLAYVGWLAERITLLGGPGYRPVLHFDCYGQPGAAFDGDLPRVAEYLERVERAAGGLAVRIEAPIDLAGREAQIEGMRRLRELLRERGCGVRIVADEWCNTLEDIDAFVTAGACDLLQVKMPDVGTVEDSVLAVLRCREGGVGAVLGGSCTETDRSARTSVHVALASRPEVQLAKPGMGVDEALMIVRNEQARTLAVLAAPL
ncbi:methylaspartate ammonia-lyase [Kitasatospora sp. NPDC051170]|uniref:methylaspartate ammonia-lyase n=1 Tax=Kitasatospora sp. NPDC051170 TaxID=3364056 RepID=UPI0037BA12F9